VGFVKFKDSADQVGFPVANAKAGTKDPVKGIDIVYFLFFLFYYIGNEGICFN